MRLHQVAFPMRQQMEGGQAMGAQRLAGLAGFAPPTLHSLGARLGSAMSRRLFNVVITNVPGPQTTLYAGDAPMLSTYPVIPLAKGQALAIGLTSYDGGVYYGLNGDRDAMPDLDVLGQCIVDALAELTEPGGRVTHVSRHDPARAGPRGGGVLGAAWMVGALTALEDELGVDPRAFDEIVGTSAGSVLAALLASGVSVADLRTHQLGGRSPTARWPASSGTTTRARAATAAAPARRVRLDGVAAQAVASCASCRRRPCSPRSCPRAEAGWTASAPWSATSSGTAGSSGRAQGRGARLRPRGAGAVRAGRRAGGRGSPRRSWPRAPSPAGTSR